MFFKVHKIIEVVRQLKKGFQEILIFTHKENIDEFDSAGTSIHNNSIVSSKEHSTQLKL